MLLPQARREFGDAARGVFTDPLQHIDQVGVWVDAVQSASDDQTLDDADVFGAEFGPAEEPGLATHRNDAQRPFQMVRVDRDIGVGEKYLEADTSFAHIVQSLDKGVARREALSLELLIDPFEEELDERFAVRQAMQLLGVAEELAIADFLLDGIQRLDLLQRFGGAGRLRRSTPRRSLGGHAPNSAHG